MVFLTDNSLFFNAAFPSDLRSFSLLLHTFDCTAVLFGHVFSVAAVDIYEVISSVFWRITKQGQIKPRLSFCSDNCQCEMLTCLFPFEPVASRCNNQISQVGINEVSLCYLKWILQLITTLSRSGEKKEYWRCPVEVNWYKFLSPLPTTRGSHLLNFDLVSRSSLHLPSVIAHFSSPSTSCSGFSNQAAGLARCEVLFLQSDRHLCSALCAFWPLPALTSRCLVLAPFVCLFFKPALDHPLKPLCVC